MQLQTWKIRGRGAFHFGEHGIGLESRRLTWPSDSLFAALIARLVSLRGAEAAKAWLGTADAPHKPPFALTSTFPYAGSVRFFPVPRASLRGEPPEGVRHKDLKKVRFVSEGIYFRLIQGERLADVFAEAVCLHNKTLWVLKDESKNLPLQHDERGRLIPVKNRRFWAAEKRPRVAVGRVPGNSEIFHVGAVRFAKACGLWFGVQWFSDDAEPRERLKNLLADLGHAGLGAERSAGYGQAEINQWEDLTFSDPDGGMWTTLSRYLPAEDETAALTAEGAAYEIQRVGGWIDTVGLRRRAVNLLAEGATLGALEKPLPYGAIVDVRPQGSDLPRPVTHPVWRVGLTVAVGYGGDR